MLFHGNLCINTYTYTHTHTHYKHTNTHIYSMTPSPQVRGQHSEGQDCVLTIRLDQEKIQNKPGKKEAKRAMT